jgi:hypothetical protein
MKKSKEKKRTTGLPGLPYPSEIIALGIKVNLSNHARHLLHVLRAAMNSENLNLECWKSEKTLALEMGVSR